MNTTIITAIVDGQWVIVLASRRLSRNALDSITCLKSITKMMIVAISVCLTGRDANLARITNPASCTIRVGIAKRYVNALSSVTIASLTGRAILAVVTRGGGYAGTAY